MYEPQTPVIILETQVLTSQNAIDINSILSLQSQLRHEKGVFSLWVKSI